MEQAGAKLCQAQVQLCLVMLAVNRKKLRANILQIVTFHLKEIVVVFHLKDIEVLFHLPNYSRKLVVFYFPIN